MDSHTFHYHHYMIYNALKEVGLENTYEPQDYLNFFCLGNREAPDAKSQSFGTSGSEKTPQVLILFKCFLSDKCFSFKVTYSNCLLLCQFRHLLEKIGGL